LGSQTHRPFVLVSGLPGSGKTTLGRRLASALGLPLLDKDDILERLFESKGIGDAAWRRGLSRESDAILEREVGSSNGAVLASFWRVSGMPAESGTPIDWIAALSAQIVTVQCDCEPEIAGERFLRRTRHPGHLDSQTSYSDLLTNLQELARLEPLSIGTRIVVDTSAESDLDSVVRDVRTALAG